LNEVFKSHIITGCYPMPALFLLSPSFTLLYCENGSSYPQTPPVARNILVTKTRTKIGNYWPLFYENVNLELKFLG